MKKTIKYTFISALFLGLASCDVDNTLPEIKNPETAVVNLDKGSADFSNYIAVGASFTAGFTDGALFAIGQQNSFPNILASKFKMGNGGDFNQPLMGDNIGGLLNPATNMAAPNAEPRFYFDPTTRAPKRLTDKPGTILGAPATNAPNFHNYGIPGAKSYHFVAPGYGSAAGLVTVPPTANPYFVRMAPTQSTVIAEAASKAPTFFTMSEVGGNDVLGYAISGGIGIDQTGKGNPLSAYGSNDITDPTVFAGVFSGMVNALTGTGAKGVVATVPYITSLPYFTTVPHNPLDPRTNASLKAQIPTLNTVYGAINAVFTAVGQTDRVIEFKYTEGNPVVIIDEDAPDLTTTIITALNNNPQFPAFVQQFGLPAAAAPNVANLLGATYGKARPATKEDLIVLPSSGIIGEVNAANVDALKAQGLPDALAAQFSAEGVTLPLADQWVLTPQEQASIKTATDAYNTTIESLVTGNANVALVDFKAILEEASKGIMFDEFNVNTSLVFGGLVGLDGIHLTGRGYALMANKILEAIDSKFGSNFKNATNGFAKAADYPTNYSPALK
ncbi:G-D-S-L family lipolytic protein [Tenacibaculum sp. 190524A02b]|uniref:G-D-S-L family lipolytic protein n=1 Tax=Tenacibaculum vairaonense TaxID=3137860 RepID=UPI0031FA4E2E